MNWLAFRVVFLHWLLWELVGVMVVSLAESLRNKAKRQATLYVIGAILAVALVAAIVAGIELRIIVGG